MDLYFVSGPDGVVLCKFRYLIEHQLADRPERSEAFVGELAYLHATEYLERTIPDLWPPADVQVAALVTGPHDHCLVTSR